MADYIYLLEHRLSAAQRAALAQVRELALAKGLTLFLVGGAVRDLTASLPVKDLDFVVQGNAFSLRKDLERAGVEIAGEQKALQSLYLKMPGSVRAELGSMLSATWPKPGKPVFTPATLGEDLRRRDFTANAMALSLNEGSYGLLIDPLNGVADIENRELRLVSNYGFIEEPMRLIRASRFMARLGWTLEEKTQIRYDTGVAEGYASALSEGARGYELEEIVHEDDPLGTLQRLETDGWMKVLAPFWSTVKINAGDLTKLREVRGMLQEHGIAAPSGAASFPLLTAKLSSKEVATLKASFPRQGFVAEIDALDAEARDFAAQLGGKGAAVPSAAWRLILASKPEAVLQAGFSSRSPAVQARLKAFASEWPQARQRIPYTLLQEMRILPGVAGYDQLLDTLFFELMDGKLATTEEMKAFLEPYSPPSPPPPSTPRRARPAKKESKTAKGRPRREAADEALDAGEESSVTSSDDTELRGDPAADDTELRGDPAADDPEGEGSRVADEPASEPEMLLAPASGQGSGPDSEQVPGGSSPTGRKKGRVAAKTPPKPREGSAKDGAAPDAEFADVSESKPVTTTKSSRTAGQRTRSADGSAPDPGPAKAPPSATGKGRAGRTSDRKGAEEASAKTPAGEGAAERSREETVNRRGAASVKRSAARAKGTDRPGKKVDQTGTGK